MFRFIVAILIFLITKNIEFAYSFLFWFSTIVYSFIVTILILINIGIFSDSKKLGFAFGFTTISISVLSIFYAMVDILIIHYISQNVVNGQPMNDNILLIAIIHFLFFGIFKILKK